MTSRFTGISFLFAFALGFAVASATVAARQAPTRDVTRLATKGTASIAGSVVTDDETHAPIRHATVTVMRSGTNDSRATSTDDRGRFLLTGLPAATYTLSAAKGAYLTVSYGAARPGAPPVPIPVADGQAFVARAMALTRGAVITGTVRDANGQPIANSRVQVNRFDVVNGERHLQFTANGLTDSRGVYRVYGLASSDYLVSATGGLGVATSMTSLTPAQEQWLEKPGGAAAGPPPPSSRPFISAPTYHPGTARIADATVITLGPGEERQGVDIALVRVSTARVSGVVYGPDGQPAAGAFILRALKGSLGLGSSALSGQSRTGTEGAFALTGVTPGDYTILARAATTTPTAAPVPANITVLNLPSGPLTLWAEADVTISGDDISGVELRLQPGMTISGTVVFEGTSPAPPSVVPYRPTLAPVDRNAPTIAITNGSTADAPAPADRTFKIEGVSPGAYRLTGRGMFTAGVPEIWRLKSVVRGTTDLLDTPFDVHPREDIGDVVVTYTDRHTEITGRFVDRAGQPASDYRALVFSTNRALWASPALPRWMASARAGVDGSFHIVGLPPGEYYVCALTEAATQVPTFDAAFFDSLVPASIKVTLAEGATVTQTFKVGG